MSVLVRVWTATVRRWSESPRGYAASGTLRAPASAQPSFVRIIRPALSRTRCRPTDAQQEQCPLGLQASELSLDRSARPVELVD